MCVKVGGLAGGIGARVLLPHVVSGTVETRAAMEELTLRNLDSFLESGEVVTPVPMPVATSG